MIGDPELNERNLVFCKHKSAANHVISLGYRNVRTGDYVRFVGDGDDHVMEDRITDPSGTFDMDEKYLL
jgi:hypothetical protein